MDDFIKSVHVHDVEKALTMQRNMRQLLLKGSFNLMNWCSNEITICHKLPQDLLAKPIEKLFHHENTERILGVKWSPFEDSIGIQIPKFDCFEGTVRTQRKALSLISKIFDPFGLISTFTITMKIQLQDIWKNGQMWDRPLEELAEQILTKTLRDMSQLADFKIPRYIGSTLNRNVQLHIFCDASKVATAKSAYLRITDVYGKTRLVFILLKTRVAPIKQQTIPKLELQASVYASRLRKKLNKELTLQIDQTVHWSDSTSVLGWIYNRNKELHKMFIANRIYEILEQSRKTEWRYVSTKENPADEGTRGLPASKIQDSSWIKGPPFLLLTEEHWPTQPTSIPIPTEPLPNLTSLYCNSIPKPRLIDCSRFSSWTKISSTTRVIFVVRNKIKNIQQTAAEINITTKLSFEAVSGRSFLKGNKRSTAKTKCQPKKSNNQLQPFP